MLKKLVIIAVFGILVTSSGSWAVMVDDFSTDTIADYNVFTPDLAMYVNVYPTDPNDPNYVNIFDPNDPNYMSFDPNDPNYNPHLALQVFPEDIQSAVFSIDPAAQHAKWHYTEDGKTAELVAMHRTELLDVNESVRLSIFYDEDVTWRLVRLWISDKESWDTIPAQGPPDPNDPNWPDPNWADAPDANFTGYIFGRDAVNYMSLVRVNGVDYKEVINTNFFGAWDYTLECRRDSAGGFTFSYLIDDAIEPNGRPHGWLVVYTENDANRPPDANNPDYSTIKYIGFGAEIPIWAWDPNSMGDAPWQLDPPQSLYATDFRVITNRPANCEEALISGYGLDEDITEDCEVDFEDIAGIADDWVRCYDPMDPNCETL